MNEDKAIDGLGGRMQIVRYAIRKTCIELLVRQDATRLPYLTKSYCSYIEHTLGRLDANQILLGIENLGIGHPLRKKKLKAIKRGRYPTKFLKNSNIKIWIKLLGLSKEGLILGIRIEYKYSIYIYIYMVVKLNVQKEKPLINYSCC